MHLFGPIDWHRIFVPSIPLTEILIRGTAVYWTLFFLLRVVMKRQSGSLSMADVLVIVLIADASQNAMTGDYKDVGNGMLLVAVFLAWNMVVDWLGYRVRWMERLVHPPPLPLVKNGVLLLQNLRKELITREELMSQLREQGVNGLHEVEEVHIEGDGRLSVIRKETSKR